MAIALNAFGIQNISLHVLKYHSNAIAKYMAS